MAVCSSSHCASLVLELHLLTSPLLCAKSLSSPSRGITPLPQPIWAGWSSLPQAPLEHKVTVDVEIGKDTSMLLDDVVVGDLHLELRDELDHHEQVPPLTLGSALGSLLCSFLIIILILIFWDSCGHYSTPSLSYSYSPATATTASVVSTSSSSSYTPLPPNGLLAPPAAPPARPPPLPA